ncbi:MAG: hypothetical protein ACRDTT_07020 [Pseudonocardiaceae bacterium]
MSTDDSLFDDVPENLVRLPSPDPVLPERLLAGILCGRPVRAGAAPEALALAELVSALRPQALSHELRGEAAAVAAFRREMSTPGWEEPESRPSRSSVGAKIAALVLASTAGMGGVAAAAADGSLPEPLQDLAHVLFGAPPAQPDGQDGDDPTGGIAPLPMPTDTSRQSPSPEEMSATSPTDVLADPTTSEPCTPDLALAEPCDVIEPGPEPGEITEPIPSPTLDAPASDGTDANGSEDAQAPSPTASPVPTATGGPPHTPPGKPLTPPGKPLLSDP